MASTDRIMINNSGARISGVGCIGAREDRDIAGEYRDGVLMAPQLPPPAIRYRQMQPDILYPDPEGRPAAPTTAAYRANEPAGFSSALI